MGDKAQAQDALRDAMAEAMRAEIDRKTGRFGGQFATPPPAPAGKDDDDDGGSAA